MRGLSSVVDHQYCFKDVYTGWPESVHDARIFVQSSTFKKGRNGTLYPNWMTSIEREDIPIIILC